MAMMKALVWKFDESIGGLARTGRVPECQHCTQLVFQILFENVKALRIGSSRRSIRQGSVAFLWSLFPIDFENASWETGHSFLRVRVASHCREWGW